MSKEGGKYRTLLVLVSAAVVDKGIQGFEVSSWQPTTGDGPAGCRRLLQGSGNRRVAILVLGNYIEWYDRWSAPIWTEQQSPVL